MIGIRTPIKRPLNQPSSSPPNAADEAGSSTQSVRKSVGEWEAGKPEKKAATPTKDVAKVLPKTSPNDTKRRSVEITNLSPPTTRSRIVQARICSNKIKAHMTNSKNIKREIKKR
ncbi:hypothetical protein PYW08_012927 [Mythimna loreyi]|uniref:Uncharacterized protein n=1 Tax=Mythimna loreyi TaxID=667449 RepID=A0ACC2Q2U1_9NEOP|nr:hypothetical protein PYW08_012927 [Mythimna loreyi]